MACIAMTLIGSCRGERAKTRDGASAAPSGDPSADPVALERGAGVARDYQKASAIHTQRCRQGAGDLTACRALLRAIIGARGVAFDQHHAAHLAQTMCTRRDPFGCAIAFVSQDVLEMSADLQASASAMFEQLDPRCLAGDPPSCEGALLVYGVGAANTAANTAAHGTALGAASCRAGILDGCAMLVTELTRCAREQEPVACSTRVKDAWTATKAADHLGAHAKLEHSCDGGDADACAALPLRAIDPKVLCAAHDYRACAALGCDDADAARRARDHGIDCDAP